MKPVEQSNVIKRVTKGETVLFAEPCHISLKQYIVVVTDNHIYSFSLDGYQLELKCTIIKARLKNIEFSTNKCTVGYEYMSLSVFVEFSDANLANRFKRTL
ncbi:hypothetical protein [Bacillus sp. JCM 19041]|uniref:hypothetical protein n=1 Tax=Bacillus sp. JCM 19041 TaxID=1460637 RepID=UPI0018D16B63